MPPPVLEKKLSMPILAPQASSPKKVPSLISQKSLASLKASRPDIDVSNQGSGTVMSPPASRPQTVDEREDSVEAANTNGNGVKTRSPSMRNNAAALPAPLNLDGIYHVPPSFASMRSPSSEKSRGAVRSPQVGRAKKAPMVPPTISLHELVESPILPSPEDSPRNSEHPAASTRYHRSRADATAQSTRSPAIASVIAPAATAGGKEASPAPAAPQVPKIPPVTFAAELRGAEFIPFSNMPYWQRQQVEVNVLRDEVFASLKGKVESKDLITAHFATSVEGFVSVEGAVECGIETAERRSVIRRLADFLNSPGVFDRSLGAVFVLCGGNASGCDPAIRRVHVQEAYINDVPVKIAEPASVPPPVAPVPENAIVSPAREDFSATQEGQHVGSSAAQRSISVESRDGRSAYEQRIRQGGIVTPHEGIYDRQSPPGLNVVYGRSASIQSANSQQLVLVVQRDGMGSVGTFADPATHHMQSVQHADGTVYRTRRYITQPSA